MVEEEGAITIPARLLSDFVGSLPNEKIDMELTPRTKGVQLQLRPLPGPYQRHRRRGVSTHPYGRGRYDRPNRPAGPGVRPSAVWSSPRPRRTRDRCLQESSWRPRSRFLTLAGADGFRLAVYKAPLLEPVSEETHAIVPSRTPSRAAAPACGPGRARGPGGHPLQEPVAGAPEGSRDSIAAYTGRLSPTTASSYPKSFGTRAVVDLQEFNRAARAASIFARDGGGIVRLQMIPGSDGAAGRMVITSKGQRRLGTMRARSTPR